MNPLIEKLRADRDALKASLDAIVSAAAEEKRDFNDAENENFNEGADKLDALNKRLEQLEQMELRNAEAQALSHKVDEATGKSPVVKVKSEALTYRSDGEHDFVKDVFAAEMRNDYSARDRLARNTEEMAHEYRAGVTSADLAGLVVPKYLTELYAPLAHEGRPFANIMNRKPLTSMTAYITKGVTGVDVAAQDGENTAVATSEPDNTDLTITAKTYAGSVTVSRQAVEFGVATADNIVGDLFRKYAQNLDTALFSGTGNNGTHKGVLLASNINDVDGSGIADFGDLWAKVTEAKTAVRKSHVGSATHIVMNSDMWGWINSQTDSEGRPLMGYDFSAPQNVGGNERGFNGLSVVVDDNFAVKDNGSLADAQRILVVNANELHLWEQNGGSPLVINVDQVGAGVLQVTFVAYGYSAFTAERYPAAISLIDDVPVGI